MGKNNSCVTVTREGDRFTYQHKSGEEPTVVWMIDVFRAANANLKAKDGAVAALSFLHNSLKAIADKGEGLDEFGVRGIAAICDCISDSLILGHGDGYTEEAIIEAVAEGMEYIRPAGL